MSETKKGRPPTGDGGQRPSGDSIITDGPTGLRRLEKAMRRILRAGKQLEPPSNTGRGDGKNP